MTGLSVDALEDATRIEKFCEDNPSMKGLPPGFELSRDSVVNMLIGAENAPRTLAALAPEGHGTAFEFYREAAEILSTWMLFLAADFKTRDERSGLTLGSAAVPQLTMTQVQAFEELARNFMEKEQPASRFERFEFVQSAARLFALVVARLALERLGTEPV